MHEATALGALAEVWYTKGDQQRPANLARQSLALHDRHGTPKDRAIGHTNLGNYLERQGEAAAARRHELAAIVYGLAAGAGAVLANPRRNLTLRHRRAAAAGTRHVLPRLADLLADPEFDALRRFLADRAVDLPALQAAIDAFDAEARAAAAAPESN